MRLARVQDLREAMGFDDIPDINRAIEFALDAATGRCATLLRTEFDNANIADTFYIQVVPAGVIFHPKVKLRQGFVDAQSVTVYRASTLTQLDDANLRETWTAKVTVDATRGTLVVGGLTAGDHFLRVIYDAGFDADATEADTYDLSAVPDWLQTAAMLFARARLDSHPLFKEAEATKDAAGLESDAHQILLPHVRYMPDAVLPY